jgi:hypothetical protein
VIAYARGTNRLRRLYLEYAPQLRPYFIDSVLVGAFAGLPFSHVLGGTLPLCTGVGVGAFLISVAIHQVHLWRHFKRPEQGNPTLFPSGAER